jgi:hypothetical protein
VNTIKKDIRLITEWVRNLRSTNQDNDYVYIRSCQHSIATANIIESMGYTPAGLDSYLLFRLSLTDAENLLAILKIMEED